jgi:hypothetical protein
MSEAHDTGVEPVLTGYVFVSTSSSISLREPAILAFAGPRPANQTDALLKGWRREGFDPLPPAPRRS